MYLFNLHNDVQFLWCESSEPVDRKQKLLELRSLLSESLWQYLKDWGVVRKLLRGDWSKENGKQLLLQLLDTGVKVPITLFWFGIIPPIPGKIWSYITTALSVYGYLDPEAKIGGVPIHEALKKWIYPSSFGKVEKRRRKSS